MPFLYNKQYTSRMLTSGWRLSDEETVNLLARKKSSKFLNYKTKQLLVLLINNSQKS